MYAIYMCIITLSGSCCLGGLPVTPLNYVLVYVIFDTVYIYTVNSIP